MLQLPRKLKKGDIFKDQTVKSVNEIIDYIKAITPIAGRNVSIDKKQNGIVINSTQGGNGKHTRPQSTGGLGYTPFKVVQFINTQTKHGQITVFPGTVFVLGKDIDKYTVWTRNFDGVGSGLGPQDSTHGSRVIQLSDERITPGYYFVTYVNYLCEYIDSNGEISLIVKNNIYLVRNDSVGSEKDDGAFFPNFPGIQCLPIASIQIYEEKITDENTGEEKTVKRFRILDQLLYSAVYFENNLYDQWRAAAILKFVDEQNPIQKFDIFDTHGNIDQSNGFLIEHIYINKGYITVNENYFISPTQALPAYFQHDFNTYTRLYILYGIKNRPNENNPLFVEVYQSDEQLYGKIEYTDPETQQKFYVYPLLLALFNQKQFIQTHYGQLNLTLDMKTLTCVDPYNEASDGIADTLRNKLHSRTGTDMTGQPILINEKQPQDYVDVHYLSAGNQWTSEIAQKMTVSGNNGFLYPKLRFDLIPGFDQSKYLTLNFNGLNQDSDPVWEEYGKLRLDSDTQTSYFLPDIVQAGQHMKIQSSGDKLVFNAIDYVQSITGDQFITATELPPEKGENDQELTAKKYQLTLNLNIEGQNGINVTKSENTYTVSYTGSGGEPGTTVAEYNGPFKIQQQTADTYVITNGTGAEKSKAFVNGVEFELGTTAVAKGQDIYVKMNLEDNSISIVNKSQADTPTTVCHYIGKISDTGKIQQQWTGGVIYRTIAAPPNIQFMLDETDILGQLAEFIVTYDEETCLSTVMLRMKDTVPEGVIAFESRTSYRNYPLTTCHIAAENSSGS